MLARLPGHFPQNHLLTEERLLAQRGPSRLHATIGRLVDIKGVKSSPPALGGMILGGANSDLTSINVNGIYTAYEPHFYALQGCFSGPKPPHFGRRNAAARPVKLLALRGKPVGVTDWRC